MLKKALLGLVLFAAAGAFGEDAKPPVAPKPTPVVNQAPETGTQTPTGNQAPETTGFVASAKQFYNNNTTLVRAGGVVVVLAAVYAVYRAMTAETEDNEWNS